MMINKQHFLLANQFPTHIELDRRVVPIDHHPPHGPPPTTITGDKAYIFLVAKHLTTDISIYDDTSVYIFY